MAAKKKATKKKVVRKAKTSKAPKRKQRVTAKQLANLRPAKKGEVRNPEGINGWTKARDRIREILAENAEDITAVQVAAALRGDDKAARLLLGPLLPAQKHEVEHSGGVTFRWEGEE